MRRIDLGFGAWVDFGEAWLAADIAESWQRDLERELGWEQRHIVLFGNRILQPRLIAWAGELPYRYSGQTLEPRALPPALDARFAALSAHVARAAGSAFNHVLINRYRDGNDSMGFHADDEPELGADPVVASLSFGAARRFLLRPLQKSASRESSLELALGAGSLLVMGGTCQRHYRHALPRQKSVKGERISLTFRRLLCAPQP
jgi:alkylated DNA repair dioxygenase AlkB